MSFFFFLNGHEIYKIYDKTSCTLCIKIGTVELSCLYASKSSIEMAGLDFQLPGLIPSRAELTDTPRNIPGGHWWPKTGSRFGPTKHF